MISALLGIELVLVAGFMPEPGPLPPWASGLRAELTTDTRTLVLGTPLLAEAELRNEGENPVRVLWPAPLPFLLVAKDGGKFRLAVYWEELRETVLRETDVNPGGRMRGEAMKIFVDHGRRRKADPLFIFSEPGRYRIKLNWALYARREGRNEIVHVPSNEVEIEVLPAAPGFSEYERFRRQDDWWCSEQQERFVRENPSGLYSCLVKSGILAYWTGAIDSRDLMAEVRSSDRLMGYARDILKEVGDARREMSDRALYLLGFAARVEADRGAEAQRAARGKEAADYLAQLEKNFPKSELVVKLKSLPGKLAAWPK
jgi:hypothetical protein